MQTGAPTKYKEEYAHQAYLYCKGCGATDIELAEFFKVSKATIENWKDKHDQFLDSVKRGKDFYDTGMVENALLNRALGMKITETRISGGGSDDEAPSAIEVTKEIPPDTGAAIFWLKNRNPARWRDKQEQVKIEMTHEEWLESLE